MCTWQRWRNEPMKSCDAARTTGGMRASEAVWASEAVRGRGLALHLDTEDAEAAEDEDDEDADVR